jgi:pimeloyl-ACP methyl ester carboxylesterase
MKSLIVTILLGLSAMVSGQQYNFKVEVSGQGERDIVFLPGYGCSGEQWAETVEALKEDYRCHVLTMPGFAGVEPVEPPMYTKMTSEIYRYVKQERLNNPIAIGHSLGAHQALYVQVVNPGTFGKIVVVDALPFLAADDNPEITPDSLNVKAESMAEFYKNITPARYRDMAVQTTESMLDNRNRKDQIVKWIANSDPYTYGYMYGEFLKIDLRQEMKEIKCPVLLLSAKGFGEKRTKEVWRAQYHLVENKRLEYNANANHYIMYDDFDWMIRHIRSFLAE